MRELRSFGLQELRIETGEDGTRYLTGYAACYNTPSTVLTDRHGKFREIIRPGAFTRAVKDQQDIRHLVNHDPSLLLGRTKSGTTVLSEDEKGLHFRTKIGGRSYESDLVESLDRGDINECSFGFVVHGDGQKWSKDPENKKQDFRELIDLDLHDVSIVTYPAYPNTSAMVTSRSFFPDGVPSEIRSHFTSQEVEETPETSDTEPANEDPSGDAEPCMCTCEACMTGDCANCDTVNCVDPNCDHSAMNQVPTAEEINLVTSAEKRASDLMLVALGDRVPSDKKELRFSNSATSEDGTLELLIYDDIGAGWYGEGITTKSVKAMIDANPDAKTLKVRINSFGGSLFDGIGICNVLRASGKPCMVYVDGLAASAASLIAMAGDKIYMANNAVMMVHNVLNVLTIAYGYASDFRKMADVLDKLSKAAAQTYVDRTGQSMKAVLELMDVETYMTAAEAVKAGFADEVYKPAKDSGKRMAEMLHESRTRLCFNNIPEQFKIQDASDQEEQGAADETEQEAERTRIRARSALALLD